MKSTLLLLALVFLLSCRRDGVVSDEPIPENPACINQIIQQNGQGYRNLHFTAIYRYKYQNRYVYYGLSDCCDQYNILFDQSCAEICSPDGGFTGSGDGKCADFRKVATEETLLWKRPQ